MVGRVIRSARLLHPGLRKRLPARRLRAIVGRRVDRVERRGKHQLIILDDERTLHVHFRMAGDWHVDSPDAPVPKYARAVIEMSDDTRVSLIDPRALSTLSLHDRGATVLPSLGPEPSEDAFNPAFLRKALASRRGAIKPALLDQRVASGIGNIYAAEALWLARIDPRATSSSLGATRLGRLVEGIRQALAVAETVAGRYADGAGARFKVYDREGEPCDRCGARIRRITQAGRSTWFCPRCQRR